MRLPGYVEAPLDPLPSPGGLTTVPDAIVQALALAVLDVNTIIPAAAL